MTDKTPDSRLSAALASALGSPTRELQPLAGGDINLAYRARLADGRVVFVKTHEDPPNGMYAAEAAALGFISQPGAPRTPAVLWAGDAGVLEADSPAMLVLEFIEQGPAAAGHDEELGRQLAALHTGGCDGFGHGNDNFIGPLPQDNRACSTWSEFYVRRRLAPMVAMAQRAGHIDRRLRADLDRLFAAIPDRVGPPEPPSRLHGDLWRGNAMFDASGHAVLVDPASYAGHREVDLAMMRLFGGFSERCFAAYADAAPLAAGSDERVPLYQLYPLLVHVVLFGAGYVGGLRRALATQL